MENNNLWRLKRILKKLIIAEVTLYHLVMTMEINENLDAVFKWCNANKLT